MADVGGDGVLAHAGPAWGVRDRGARRGIFGKISLIVGFFVHLLSVGLLSCVLSSRKGRRGMKKFGENGGEFYVASGYSL